MVPVHHRTARIAGHEVFYRESGNIDSPVLLLLHGYPSSSHMFRHLIPALADRFRVIAPDHIGFGRSAAPAAEDFPYTFAALTEVTQQLLDALGISRFAVYVQDYGAPIAWRLALGRPAQVTGIISQNGNAYEEGFVEEFWAPIWRHGRERSEDSARALRPALGREAVIWQYTHGVADPSTVSPDAWEHDLALLARPGVESAQLALFADYASNRALYPRFHEWLREHRVPVLAVWGKNDLIFGPEGARAFAHDAPDAQIALLDGGHFLLESHLDEVVSLIRAWEPLA